MLSLVLMVPLALVGLDFVVPWPSASGVGLLPVLVPSGWASEAVRSRRLFGPEPPLPSPDHHFDDDPFSGAPDLEMLLGHVVIIVILAIAGSVAQCVFACSYKQEVTDKRPPLQGGATQLPSGDFTTGPFNCFDDTSTCMHAWCCTSCRAGDTYQAAGIEQYWTVIGLVILASIIGNMVGGFVNKLMADPSSPNSNPGQYISWLVTAAVMGGIFHKYRRKLRAKLGGREEEGPSVFIDVLMFGFCTWCVVAQEARALDAATGVKVECCCNLTNSMGQPLEYQPLVGHPPGQPQPLIGQPVYANPVY